MPKTKKSTSTTKSPAPATKSARKPARKPAASAIASAIKTASSAPAPAPVPFKSAVADPVTTTITALYDVGFGNSLYIRGEGPGLSWDKGVLMTCIAPERWQIALGESALPFTFKLLINDTTWSTGPDFTVRPGDSETVAPRF